MADHQKPSGAQKMFGDFAPALVAYTDEVLFGQVWEHPELSKRDRSTFHLAFARQNGLTEAELKDAITHLAFYAGWPRAMSAMSVAKQVSGTTSEEN
ncbi:carboxymuconolactone decarboxylase family protein [Actinoplanes sp. NPDC051494]|uniref:carboxymuconolactone decarboxylase family protein n=1 Tax=Actinoplanes sp. NPDC051494 TaxID=3363907 RepID=UPI0037A683CC